MYSFFLFNYKSRLTIRLAENREEWRYPIGKPNLMVEYQKKRKSLLYINFYLNLFINVFKYKSNYHQNINLIKCI